MVSRRVTRRVCQMVWVGSKTNGHLEEQCHDEYDWVEEPGSGGGGGGNTPPAGGGNTIPQQDPSKANQTETVPGGVIVRDGNGNIIKDTRGIINQSDKTAMEQQLLGGGGSSNEPTKPPTNPDEWRAAIQKGLAEIASGAREPPAGFSAVEAKRIREEIAATTPIKSQQLQNYYGNKLLSQTPDEYGNVREYVIRDDQGRRITYDAQGHPTEIKDKNYTIDLEAIQNGSDIIGKDNRTGRTIYFGNENDIEKLNATTLSGILTLNATGTKKIQLVSSKKYAAGLEKQSKMEGAEQFANTIENAGFMYSSNIMGGSGQATQIFRITKTGKGTFLITVNPTYADEPMVTNWLQTAIQDNQGNFKYATVIKNSDNSYTIIQKDITDTAYVAGQGYRTKIDIDGDYITDIDATSSGKDITISNIVTASGQKIPYSKFTPKEKEAFTELLFKDNPEQQASLKQQQIDLNTSLSKAIGGTADISLDYISTDTGVQIQQKVNQLKAEGKENIQLSETLENGVPTMELTWDEVSSGTGKFGDTFGKKEPNKFIIETPTVTQVNPLNEYYGATSPFGTPWNETSTGTGFLAKDISGLFYSINEGMSGKGKVTKISGYLGGIFNDLNAWTVGEGTNAEGNKIYTLPILDIETWGRAANIGVGKVGQGFSVVKGVYTDVENAANINVPIFDDMFRYKSQEDRQYERDLIRIKEIKLDFEQLNMVQEKEALFSSKPQLYGASVVGDVALFTLPFGQSAKVATSNVKIETAALEKAWAGADPTFKTFSKAFVETGTIFAGLDEVTKVTTEPGYYVGKDLWGTSGSFVAGGTVGVAGVVFSMAIPFLGASGSLTLKKEGFKAAGDWLGEATNVKTFNPALRILSSATVGGASLSLYPVVKNELPKMKRIGDEFSEETKNEMVSYAALGAVFGVLGESYKVGYEKGVFPKISFKSKSFDFVEEPDIIATTKTKVKISQGGLSARIFTDVGEELVGKPRKAGYIGIQYEKLSIFTDKPGTARELLGMKLKAGENWLDIKGAEPSAGAKPVKWDNMIKSDNVYIDPGEAFSFRKMYEPSDVNIFGDVAKRYNEAQFRTDIFGEQSDLYQFRRVALEQKLKASGSKIEDIDAFKDIFFPKTRYETKHGTFEEIDFGLEARRNLEQMERLGLYGAPKKGTKLKSSLKTALKNSKYFGKIEGSPIDVSRLMGETNEIAQLFGSTTQKMWMSEREFVNIIEGKKIRSKMRKSGDIEVLTPIPEEFTLIGIEGEAKLKIKGQKKIFKMSGGKARISPEKPSLGEGMLPNEAEYHHIFDPHSLYDSAEAEITLSSYMAGWGYKLPAPTRPRLKNPERIELSTLEEQLLRKGTANLFSGDWGRLSKDTADEMVGGLFKAKRGGKKVKLEKSILRTLETFPKENWDDFLGAGQLPKIKSKVKYRQPSYSEYMTKDYLFGSYKMPAKSYSKSYSKAKDYNYSKSYSKAKDYKYNYDLDYGYGYKKPYSYNKPYGYTKPYKYKEPYKYDYKYDYGYGYDYGYNYKYNYDYKYKYKYDYNYDYNYNYRYRTPKRVKIAPLFGGIPAFDGKRKKGSKGNLSKSYSPDVTAILTGIKRKGKAPKYVTGFDIQPLFEDTKLPKVERKFRDMFK